MKNSKVGNPTQEKPKQISSMALFHLSGQHLAAIEEDTVVLDGYTQAKKLKYLNF